MHAPVEAIASVTANDKSKAVQKAEDIEPVDDVKPTQDHIDTFDQHVQQVHHVQQVQIEKAAFATEQANVQSVNRIGSMLEHSITGTMMKAAAAVKSSFSDDD